MLSAKPTLTLTRKTSHKFSNTTQIWQMKQGNREITHVLHRNGSIMARIGFEFLRGVGVYSR